MATVRIRRATHADIPGILELQYACYPTLAQITQWRQEHLESHQRVFPEGQFVGERDGLIVGLCCTFIARSEVALKPHTFRDITARGTFASHDREGDALYGAEIMVHPNDRRRGIATKFYEARFALVRQLGLRYFVAGGRIPGYAKHKGKMTAQQYVDAVVAGHLTDRVLTAQLKNGLRVVAVIPNYLNDPNSDNYASLLVWENPMLALGSPGQASPAALSAKGGRAPDAAPRRTK